MEEIRQLIKNSKFTKGKWGYTTDELNYGTITSDLIAKKEAEEGFDDEVKGGLAQCWEDFHNGRILSKEECIANTKLIASSPELLNSIICLIEIIEDKSHPEVLKTIEVIKNSI